MNLRTLGLALTTALIGAACGVESASFTRADGIDIDAGSTVELNVLANDQLPPGAQLVSLASHTQLDVDIEPDGDVTISAGERRPAGDHALTYVAADNDTRWFGTLIVRTSRPDRNDEGNEEADEPVEPTDLGPGEPVVGPAMSFTLSDNDVTFASSTVGSSGQSAPVTITNTGAVEITPTLALGAPFYATIEADCESVAPGATCVFRVGIRATEVGPFGERSNVVADGESQPLTVAGTIEEAPTGFDFTLTATATELTRTTTTQTGFVTNDGETTIADIELTVDSQLVIVSPGECVEAQLQPGDTCSFSFGINTEEVEFGTGRANLTATVNDVSRSLVLEYSWDPIRAAGFVTPSVNFPDNNIVETVQIRNTGELSVDRPGTVRVTDIGALGGELRATVDPDFCANTISPGGECPVSIRLITWPGNGTEPITLTLGFGDGVTDSITVTFEPVSPR